MSVCGGACPSVWALLLQHNPGLSLRINEMCLSACTPRSGASALPNQAAGVFSLWVRGGMLSRSDQTAAKVHSLHNFLKWSFCLSFLALIFLTGARSRCLRSVALITALNTLNMRRLMTITCNYLATAIGFVYLEQTMHYL